MLLGLTRNATKRRGDRHLKRCRVKVLQASHELGTINRVRDAPPERRARQAEAIREWRPWEKSTGPKSQEGKAMVACNAYKGGTWKLLRELARALREQLRLVS